MKSSFFLRWSSWSLAYHVDRYPYLTEYTLRLGPIAAVMTRRTR